MGSTPNHHNFITRYSANPAIWLTLSTCIFLLLLLFVPFNQAFAERDNSPADNDVISGPVFIEPFALPPEEDVLNITPSLYYLIEEESPISIDNIVEQGPILPFRLVESESIVKSGKPIWYTFKVINNKDEARSVILNFQEFLFEEIQLIYQNQAGRHEYTTGMNYPYDSRIIDYRMLAFPLTIDANSEQVVYARILSSHIPMISPVIGEPLAVAQQAAKYVNINVLSIGICTGIFLFMLIFIPLSMNNSDGYIYCLFLFTVTLIMAYMGGYLYSWIPNQPELHKFIQIFLLGIISPINLMMLRVFFDIDWKDKSSNLLIFGVIACFTLLLLSYPILGYENLILPVIILTLVNFFVLFVICVRYYIKGSMNAGLYLFSSLIFIGAALYSVLGASAAAEYNPLLRHSYSLGIVFQSLIFAVAVARKIYWELREKENLAQKAAIAEAQTRTKSEFLAAMSHEIRTPINGVIGMSQMLQTTPLNHDQKHYTDIISNSGNTLLRVINDILDYSKIEAGKMELEHVAINLDELITQTCTGFLNEAVKNQLAFSASIDPDCPIMVYGDPVRLQQVLNNLLSNAFKFTTEGGVNMRVSGQVIGDSVELIFYIKDSGIGISKEKQRSLFDSFSQADRSTTRHYGGTGLGLSISKQLVNLMGGDIGVKSKEGEGAKFRFSVKCHLDPIKQQQWDHENQIIEDKSILLLHPTSAIETSLKRHFTHWGAQVVQCNNIEQALQLIRMRENQGKGTFDIIVALSLPLMQATKVQLSQLYSHEIPIILSEANHRYGPSKLQHTYKKYTILQLPHTLTVLRNTMLDVLNGIESDLSYSSNFENLSSKISKRHVLVAEDNPVNQQVIAAMLGQHGLIVDFAQDGKEVIQLYQSLHNNLDLVFMDCEMPEVDGFEATLCIRQFESQHQLKETPIIALTAHVLPESANQCIESGMNEVITKPVNNENLKEVLLKYLVPDQ